jgi:hypothetical protein
MDWPGIEPEPYHQETEDAPPFLLIASFSDAANSCNIVHVIQKRVFLIFQKSHLSFSLMSSRYLSCTERSRHLHWTFLTLLTLWSATVNITSAEKTVLHRLNHVTARKGKERAEMCFNPFQSNFSANRILPSSYLFWAGKRLVDYL